MAKREYKRTAATRETLYQAIIELAKEKEYEKITIRDICAKAEVSIGSFYHHFHSKEELAVQAYYRVDRLINEDFCEMGEKYTAEEYLYLILKSYITYVSQEIGMLVRVYYKLVMDETSVSAFDPDRLYYKTLMQVLELCGEEGVIQKQENYHELTEYCIRFIRGLIFDWSLQKGDYDLVERFEKDYKLFINGLKKHD